jgi:GNAT superfamily N-acetyltransferase
VTQQAAIERDVTIRTYQPGDEDGLLRALQAAFDRWPSREVAVAPAEYLAWKLRSSEEALRGHTVAEANGHVVGCRLFRYFDVHTSNGPMRGCWGFDAAVHPDYRGQGVMRRLRDLALERNRGVCDLQIGGYSRIEAMIKVHADEERYAFANTIELLERARPGGPAVPILDAVAPPAFDARFDVFWEAARGQFDFMFKRDRTVLSWRYGDVRGGSYHVRTAEEHGELLAYVVCKRERDKGYIVDLLALAGRLDALDGAVGEAVAYLDADGVSAVRCWLPGHHPYQEVLARHGFAHRRFEKTMRWGPLRTSRSGLSVLDDPHGSFHFTMGDSDLI